MADAVVAGLKKPRFRSQKKGHRHIADDGISPAHQFSWSMTPESPGVSAAHPGKDFYVAIFHASPIDRIGIIKAGVPAKGAKLLMGDFDFDQHVLFDALSLKTATVNRKAVANQTLSPEDSERVLGLAKLVGQVAAMLEESGESEGFDVPSWLSRWLCQPLPALGGTMPLRMLDTMEGQALVSRTLSQMQSGAYA